MKTRLMNIGGVFFMTFFIFIIGLEGILRRRNEGKMTHTANTWQKEEL